MSIVYRIKHRIRTEGLIRTFIYALKAFIYIIREFYYNTILDIWFSGKLLKGNHKSSYKHLGANDVYHTDYLVMTLIFRLIPVSKNDVLVDVGCGKGRVINYWLSKRIKNKIVGLELDPQIAQQTAAQFSRWNNVSIIQGDAISNIPADATILYFYNPFSEEKVIEFEERLSLIFINKPLKIIYYRPKSIHAFQNERWDIKDIDFEKDLGKKRWGRIYNFHELSIITHKI